MLQKLILLPIVSLVDRFSNGTNVFPLSLLIFNTGSLLVAFLSHHVRSMLSPSTSIIASTESALLELLKFISLLNVLSLFVDSKNYFVVISCLVGPPNHVYVIL